MHVAKNEHMSSVDGYVSLCYYTRAVLMQIARTRDTTFTRYATEETGHKASQCQTRQTGRITGRWSESDFLG
jgi:hypothetical protein